MSSNAFEKLKGGYNSDSDLDVSQRLKKQRTVTVKVNLNSKRKNNLMRIMNKKTPSLSQRRKNPKRKSHLNNLK